MMNTPKSMLTLLLTLLLLALPDLGRADTDDLRERRGFLMGVGPLVGVESNALKRFGGGAEFRIGGGFNEKLLLYYEDSFFFTQKNGEDISLNDGQAKLQFFFYKNFYFNIGVGLSFGEFERNGFFRDTDLGFVTSAGFGHEFRLTPHFALSPEATFHYRRIEKTHYVTPGIILHCGWYF